ncbi:2Fe-2S iron-sulfur cluster binding domain-containing protein [Phthorimaea operculella]|nr:2Fe-2S iron-sulfur cluster binding domain-containing protein [Phthorimaea operculella]
MNRFKIISSTSSRYFVTTTKLRKQTEKQECKHVQKKPDKKATDAPPKPIPPDIRVIKVYRFDGIKSNSKPRMQKFEIDVSKIGKMMLDVMIKMKDMDPSFTFRRSCREGICGSCAVNLQGHNCLACIKEIPKAKTILLYPVPHMYVIRDLVVDMTHFTNSYDCIKPYLIRRDKSFEKGKMQLAQSPKDNDKMIGLYECVLCGCCSTSCPSYWWNGRRFMGPASLLHAYRWVIDSRDEGTYERLHDLRDDFKAFRCHTIMNCTIACPKGLNPAKAIGLLKRLIAGMETKPVPEMQPEKFLKK